MGGLERKRSSAQDVRIERSKMILGPNTLNKLIRNGLIKGLPDNYQASGMGVDLRCDQLLQHYGNP